MEWVGVEGRDPELSQGSFDIGDRVCWIGYDHDLCVGAVGTVYGFVEERGRAFRVKVMIFGWSLCW